MQVIKRGDMLAMLEDDQLGFGEVLCDLNEKEPIPRISGKRNVTTVSSGRDVLGLFES